MSAKFAGVSGASLRKQDDASSRRSHKVRTVGTRKGTFEFLRKNRAGGHRQHVNGGHWKNSVWAASRESSSSGRRKFRGSLSKIRTQNFDRITQEANPLVRYDRTLLAAFAKKRRNQNRSQRLRSKKSDRPIHCHRIERIGRGTHRTTNNTHILRQPVSFGSCPSNSATSTKRQQHIHHHCSIHALPKYCRF